MAKVNFQTGTLSQYTSLSAPNTDTLYFITDAQRVYKGNVDVTQNIVIVTGFDTEGGIYLDSAVETKMYINPTTWEMRVKNGSSWSILSPGYITDGTNWTTVVANSAGKFATVKAINDALSETLSSIAPDVSYDNATGTLTVGETTARLTGVVNGISYNSSQIQLTVSSISASGAPTTQTISLPKDNFVRSGHYEPNYTLPDPPGGKGPAIVLVVNDGTEDEGTKIVIPAASLVEVYTGGSTQNITVNVSEANQITATAIIDSAAGNALVSGEGGLRVSIIGTDVTDGNLVLADGTGKLKDGGVTVLASGALGNSSTQLPVASVIATAISAAVSAAQGTLQEAIEALGTRVTNLETFQSSLSGKYLTESTTDNLVGFLDADGNIKDSGKKAGGATLAESPDENTLATEAAVAAVFSWGSLE